MCLCLVCLAFSAFPQSIGLRNYTVASGLPSNTVHRLLQDSLGYMWLATSAGLSRFDGVSFKNYSSETNLKGHEILNLFQDSRGRIWLLNSIGAAEYFYEGKFYNAENDPELAGGKSKGFFISGMEDSRGNIWLQSPGGVLRKAPGKPIEKIEEVGGKPIPGCMFVFEDEDGDVIVPSRNNVTYNLSKEEGYVGGVSIDRKVSRFHQGPDGLLFKSVFNKLYTYRDYKAEPIRVAEIDSPKDIISIQVEESGHLVLGTWGGLLIYEPGDTALSKEKRMLEGIPVFSSFVDREGNRWATTMDHGIYCIPNTQLDQWTTNNGLPYDEVHALAEDADGRIWVAFQDGQAGYVEGGKFVRHDLEVPEGNLGNRCMQILQENSGKMWFAYERNLVGMDGEKEELYDISCKGIYISEEGEFWVPTYSGVVIFSSENALEPLTREVSYRLAHPEMKRTKHIARSPDGKLYAATFEGLATLTPTSMERNSSEMEINHFDFLTEDSLVVCTHGNGLWARFPKEEFFITQADGLSGNYCNVSKRINDSIFWVGTNSGLDKVRLHQNAPPTISNILSYKINGLHVSGDSTWVASSNGLVLLDNNTEPTLFQPVPVLEGVTVNDEALDWAQESSLASDHNNFTIDWTTCFFQDPSRIRFRFRLEGADQDWRHTRQRSISYLGLAPGDYTFHLESSPNGQDWTPTRETLHFTIRSPLWRRAYVQILAFFFLISIGVLLYRRRIRAIRQKSMLIADSMKQREIALRAQMNPHFVFNALNSIQQYILLEDPDGALGYLSKFSRLIRMILENSLHSVIPLEKELEALNLYLELEKLRVGEKFQYEIQVEEGLESEFVVFPGLVLQPLAENAIWHGILPKKDGLGRLWVKIHQEGERVKVVVDDNGVGREASKRNRQQGDMNKKTSLGLENIWERLDIFAQNNDGEVSMEIEDKTDEDGKPVGTRITIVIPYSETPY